MNRTIRPLPLRLLWLALALLPACTGSNLEEAKQPPPPPPPTATEAVADAGSNARTAEAAPIALKSAIPMNPTAVMGIVAPQPSVAAAAPPPAVEREQYHPITAHAITRTVEQPVSTFSIDVDTGSYSNVRRFLNQGALPPPDAVRVEEMINYFDYHYPAPKSREQPFALLTEIAPSPWNSHNHLLRVALQSYRLDPAELPPANLVFLVDVSGSMQSPDKLDLLKSGLKLLLKQMDRQDSVALVVYAGASGVVLEPTAGDQRARIESALDSLSAGGSTNGGAGIRLAYQMARQAFKMGGINRILLATDGDFNVGTTDFATLKALVEQERRDGIALTTLGFGSGNYNDHLMEQLADAGNGNYSYIDSVREAHKVLVAQMGGTLHTLAQDVKIQIEFNPAQVSEYRLIGYENRQLNREDFNNDKVDAGEIGAGHSVTALYEITLAGQPTAIEPLRYAAPPAAATADEPRSNELAHLRLRYKRPQQEQSQLLEEVVTRSQITPTASESLGFAAAVAAFGQRLRGSSTLGSFDYPAILALARQHKGADEEGYRGELVQLITLSQSLAR